MSETIEFLGVYPIGNTDVSALPVKELGPAIGYYTCVLGFSLVYKTETHAALQRDKAFVGLAKNGADPEQASCYFAVRNLEDLHKALTERGIEPSAIRDDSHDGKPLRIFFAKEPYGVCFCFGENVKS